MDVQDVQTNVAAKLPMIKPNEFELWRMRVEQYFMVQDYALWDIILYGDSFTLGYTDIILEGKTKRKRNTGPSNNDEKIQKRNDQKARNLLLMTIPGEQMLSFSKYPDAKTLFEEICAWFGGNETTKKTQKTLLKQKFENFSSNSNESLDKLFSRLHKLVSQLAVLGVEIAKEDLNMKFLRSLPDEFHTHVVVWMNKPDIKTMKLNDLFNNFKIVEQSLKKSGIYSTSSGNVALLSSPSIIKSEEVDEVESVSTAIYGGPSTSSQKNVAGLGDLAFYVFMSSQTSGSSLIHEDLDQLDDNDLEEMDIKW